MNNKRLELRGEMTERKTLDDDAGILMLHIETHHSKREKGLWRWAKVPNEDFHRETSKQNKIGTGLVGLIEKTESQTTKGEHERYSETFHDVLTIDTPGHERDRFLVPILISGTTCKKKNKQVRETRRLSINTDQHWVVRRWCRRSHRQ